MIFFKEMKQIWKEAIDRLNLQWKRAKEAKEEQTLKRFKSLRRKSFAERTGREINMNNNKRSQRRFHDR